MTPTLIRDRLQSAGYVPDPDPDPLVMRFDRPAPGWRDVAATVLVADLLGDGPTRFLQQSVELVARARAEVLEERKVDYSEHTAVFRQARMLCWAVFNPFYFIIKRQAGRQAHQIALLLTCAEPPAWAAGVLDGTLHDHGKRSVATLIWAPPDRLLLPRASSRPCRDFLEQLRLALGAPDQAKS